MSDKIIALHASHEDPDTGAPVTHFVIAQYTVRTLNAQGCQAVLQGYVSRTAFETGRRPLMYLTVDMQELPQGDVLQWLYQRIPDVPEQDLTGAVPVTVTE